MRQDAIDKFTILKKLGENIGQERLKKGLSQEELAFRIDSARNFIGCIERAEKASTIITLCRISKALEINAADLLKGIDS